MEIQNSCVQYRYNSGHKSISEDLEKTSTFPDVLMTLKEEQNEDAMTVPTTAPSDPSSEVVIAHDYINNCNDISKISNQSNRNNIDDQLEDIGSHQAIVWSLDGNNTNNKCNIDDNGLSDECGRFIDHDIPTFITPNFSISTNDDGDSLSDTVSELDSDMASNNNRRCIFSNYWHGKDSNNYSETEQLSSYNSRTPVSSYTPRSDLSGIITFPGTTAKKGISRKDSKRCDTTDILIKDEINTSRIHYSPDDERRNADKTFMEEQDTSPPSCENQPNPIHPSSLGHSRRSIISNNNYKSISEHIPKVSSTSALLPSRRARGQSQVSCLRRTSSATEPKTMNRCESGGKVTFDSKVSIVEYNQQFTLHAVAGWSKLFM